MLSRIIKNLFRNTGKAPVVAAPVGRATPTSVPVRAVASAKNETIQVRVDGRELWQVRGWQRHGSTLRGTYRTPFGSYVGLIQLSKDCVPEFFIINPLEALLTGSHSACFRIRDKKRKLYAIHFYLKSRNIDAGIVGIEKLIRQALLASRGVA